MSFRVEADSWAHPGAFVEDEYRWMGTEGQPLGFAGCDELPFAPLSMLCLNSTKWRRRLGCLLM